MKLPEKIQIIEIGTRTSSSTTSSGAIGMESVIVESQADKKLAEKYNQLIDYIAYLDEIHKVKE